MSEAKKHKSTLYYVNAVFFMLIPLVFFQLPPVGSFTDVGMNVLGCFLAALWGWITIGLIWPSVYVLCVLAFSGYYDGFGALCGASFGDSTTVLLIFMLAFAGLIEASGVGKAISIWFVSRKFVQGKPWIFCFAFLFSVYILGSMTSGTPSVLLGWSLLSGICAAVGYKPGDGLAKYLFFGVLVAGPLGMDLFPFKPVSIVALSVYTSMTGLEMNYAEYISFALILDSLIMIGYLLVGRFIFKIDVSKLKNFDPEKLNAKEILKLTLEQKIILILTAFLLVAFIVPSFLPDEWLFTQIFSTLGTTGTIMIVMAAMCFLKIKGKPLCNFQEMARKGISWDAIMLTATVLPVTGALSDDAATGFITTITEVVGPIVDGKPEVLFVLLFMLIATVFTNFCSNAGTASSLAPIALTGANLIGANPAMLIVFVIKCCHFAYFTPAASPATALAIAQPEWISQKEMLKYGLTLIAVAFIICSVIGIPVGSFIFSI